MQPLLPLPPDVKAALTKFESWGAQVEHILFDVPSIPDEDSHKQAAQAGLESLIKSRKRDFPRWKGAQVDASKITRDRAQPQSVQQFFSPGYDVSADSMILRGRTSHFLNNYFREGTKETKANVVPQSVYKQNSPFDPNAVTLGYVRALFEPPYGLSKRGSTSRLRLTNRSHLTNLEIVTAFRRLLGVLFGDPHTLEIYAWPTDCSEYFDAGHEWWGSFFWTVYAPAKNWIVTILASATD